MPLPGPIMDHLDIMVDLLRNRPLSQDDLVRELKECREAYKKVGLMGSLQGGGTDVCLLKSFDPFHVHCMDPTRLLRYNA
jgi:hypothetical protein